jgi:hypothetical protein
MPPGHYFATSNTSQLEMRARTLQALQFEGYSGHGEVTILSDGAEIMKRLPKALPKPTTHIIDWFHLAMTIRPMRQIADHIVGFRPILCEILAVIDEEIKALKWKLWAGRSRDLRARKDGSWKWTSWDARALCLPPGSTALVSNF